MRITKLLIEEECIKKELKKTNKQEINTKLSRLHIQLNHLLTKKTGFKMDLQKGRRCLDAQCQTYAITLVRLPGRRPKHPNILSLIVCQLKCEFSVVKGVHCSPHSKINFLPYNVIHWYSLICPTYLKTCLCAYHFIQLVALQHRAQPKCLVVYFYYRLEISSLIFLDKLFGATINLRR